MNDYYRQIKKEWFEKTDWNIESINCFDYNKLFTYCRIVIMKLINSKFFFYYFMVKSVFQPLNFLSNELHQKSWFKNLGKFFKKNKPNQIISWLLEIKAKEKKNWMILQFGCNFLNYITNFVYFYHSFLWNITQWSKKKNVNGFLCFEWQCKLYLFNGDQMKVTELSFLQTIQNNLV